MEAHRECPDETSDFTGPPGKYVKKTGVRVGAAAGSLKRRSNSR